MKKAIALLTAFLILLSSSMIGANAIPVERDGTQYILRSHTPTSGDINVLMIRIGFADYDVDDENDPADSEETLLAQRTASTHSMRPRPTANSAYTAIRSIIIMRSTAATATTARIMI